MDRVHDARWEKLELGWFLFFFAKINEGCGQSARMYLIGGDLLVEFIDGLVILKHNRHE